MLLKFLMQDGLYVEISRDLRTNDRMEDFLGSPSDFHPTDRENLNRNILGIIVTQLSEVSRKTKRNYKLYRVVPKSQPEGLLLK